MFWKNWSPGPSPRCGSATGREGGLHQGGASSKGYRGAVESEERARPSWQRAAISGHFHNTLRQPAHRARYHVDFGPGAEYLSAHRCKTRCSAFLAYGRPRYRKMPGPVAFGGKNGCTIARSAPGAARFFAMKMRPTRFRAPESEGGGRCADAVSMHAPRRTRPDASRPNRPKASRSNRRTRRYSGAGFRARRRFTLPVHPEMPRLGLPRPKAPGPGRHTRRRPGLDLPARGPSGPDRPARGRPGPLASGFEEPLGLQDQSVADSSPAQYSIAIDLQLTVDNTVDNRWKTMWMKVE